jgi:hypothetical protein
MGTAVEAISLAIILSSGDFDYSGVRGIREEIADNG